MKRFVLTIAMVTLMMMLLSGCCVSHDMQPATCTEPARCSKCGKTEGEPLGHTEVTDPVLAPTCTEAGLSEGSHCSVCGVILKEREAIAPLGHTEVIMPAIAPTCTEAGCTEGLHCSVCGEILKSQELIEPHGHDWEEATFSHPRTCRICGETEGEALGAGLFVAVPADSAA